MINKTLFSDQEFEQIMALLEAEDGKSYFFEAMQLMDKFFYEAGKRSYDEYEKLHADVNTTSLYGYAANNVRNYRGYREALHNLADALDNAYKAQDGLWYYRFAIALTYMGYVKDAKKFLQEALFFKDVHYLVYFLLAKLNVKSGYYKKALNLVEVALNKEPLDAELLELKELILQRANFYKILDPSLSDQEVEILNQGILPLNCSANLRQSATVLPNLENLGKILEFLEIKSAKEYSAHHSCIFYSFKIMPVRLVFDMNLNGVSKLEVRFIQGLIQKIEPQTKELTVLPNGMKGDLIECIVHLDYSYELIYRLDEDERTHLKCYYLSDGTLYGAPEFVISQIDFIDLINKLAPFDDEEESGDFLVTDTISC